jgi:superfamily II DNA or RNA helicase
MQQLRKHQQDFADVTDGIIGGSGITTILPEVTPGGGKSALPIIAGKLKDAGLIDKIAWICPRQSLQNQAERNFMDPFFRRLLGHNLSIRQSTSDQDPCRGLDGFVTTYQAVTADNRELQYQFSRNRYALVLDEFHHVELDGTWHKALAPLVNMARYLIPMTGTMERGDKANIAFLPYKEEKRGKATYLRPCPELNPRIAHIRYTRTDALAEQAIIPLKFHQHDGEISWIDKDGFEENAHLSTVTKDIAGAAIYSALSTEYAETLLSKAIKHWERHRQDVANAAKPKLLVVTANLEHAEKTVELIRRMGHHSMIATSHDSKQALKNIHAYKYKGLDILVSIAMAYEGFSCKPISHVACLTHIRSQPWIEQMVARSVRIDPALPYDVQYGHIFAPDDSHMKRIISQIQGEQAPIFKKKLEEQEQPSLFGDDPVDGPKIIPLKGELTGSREITLAGNGSTLPAPALIPFANPVKTPAEIENDLRGQIDSHIKVYAGNNGYDVRDLNSRLKERFWDKARADLTTPELRCVLAYCKREWPQSRIGRGTGRKPVPKKAMPWTGKVPILRREVS